jgi:hypothetical protein
MHKKNSKKYIEIFETQHVKTSQENGLFLITKNHQA